MDKFSNPRRIQDTRLDQTKTTKPSPNLGKYRSLGSYSKRVLKSSLITSFPEIATSKSRIKRLVKVLVFIICTIGFSYQTFNFLKMYLAYPTVVNVQTTNPFMVDQPGITVCNSNRKRRTFICTLENHQCLSLSPDIFCASYSLQCPGNNSENAFPWVPFLPKFVREDFDWEYTKEETHNESMFRNCTKHIDGKVSIQCNKPYMPVPVILADGEPNYCYTIESQYGKPEAKPEIYSNFFTMEINLNTQPEEYVDLHAPIQMQIALHDRKSLVNPFTDGSTLRGGVQYTAYVSMVSKERLPFPYDTNCTDYLKKWRENNGTGPLNEVMCVEQCKLNKLLERGYCIDKTVNFPHEEQLCPKRTILMTEGLLEECYSKCEYACSDDKYEVQFQEIADYDSKFKCGDGDVWCKYNIIRIKLNFLEFRHTTYVHQPKFESVEMFSYIGGYMGMWLGLSLVSLFDLFETLGYLLFYPIGRAVHKKQKMNRLVTSTKHYRSDFYNSPTVVY